MTEPEVSIKIALYYIRNGLTDKDVKVSIDGAHVKTGNTVHFDIKSYMAGEGCIKIDGKLERWQGVYAVSGCEPKIIVSSEPGIGDVNIKLLDGKQLYVESKKGKKEKAGQEYPLMREAIGQLMTGCTMAENIIPVVAVPYTAKSNELAIRWAGLPQIKMVGIKFILVKEDGSIVYK